MLIKRLASKELVSSVQFETIQMGGVKIANNQCSLFVSRQLMYWRFDEEKGATVSSSGLLN